MERTFELIEILLLNFLFLLLPIVITLIYFEHRLNTANKYNLIIWSSVSLLLCMAFPVELGIGFIFDLRYIPFIILALYGGTKMVFPLYIVLNVYRFIIGGDGIYQSLVFSTIIFIVISLFHKQFLRQRPARRIVYGTFGVFFTIGFYLITLSYFYRPVNDEYWTLAVYALGTHIVFTFMILSLIEKILSNIKKREVYLQSMRLKDISELSASIAHEIRNPLTVTNGFLQLLQHSKTISQEEKKYINLSLVELERAEMIVNEFLDFTKPQTIQLVSSDFKTEIEYVENILRPFANEKKVELQVHFSNSLKVEIDHNLVRQCFINLVKNSIEAIQHEDGLVSIQVKEQKGHIEISVQDNGGGMTREETLQLGIPYYSTKTEGTGLGLFMVYRTIDQMNGKIEVRSKPGKGTTFLITIPV